MQSFPMFFKVAGRRVVVAGGGEQAAQKTRLLLKTEAEIVLLAPDLDDELSGLLRDGRITHDTSPITAAHFENTALVFVATGCPGIDASLHDIAKSAGAVVNVVDQPELCDVTTPSIVDRDPVVVAIGTEGTAPVLGRQIKTEIEQILDPSLGRFAALAGRLRDAVAASVPREGRRAFWRWAFAGTPWQTHKRGAERDAARILKEAIANHGGAAAQAEGSIALVGAGPGARDLLTLRAVERLQEADIIFYDRLVDPAVLELARRDAERVYVGKTVGASSWPQDRINDLIVAEARKGRSVVRLKSGDPGIFGRAREELDAAEAAGIPVEIVPGITAAAGAAAAMGRPLTERGETGALVFATGAARDGDLPPDWGALAQPGTTLALYMSVRSAPQIQENLMSAGVAGSANVRIVESASLSTQRVVETKLENLTQSIQDNDISHPAMILVTNPKRKAADRQMRA